MAELRKTGGKVEDSPRLPEKEDETARLLSESKLGAAQPGDPAGASDEEALSESKLGAKDDGGRKGQGGMRDPAKTSDPTRMKPS